MLSWALIFCTYVITFHDWLVAYYIPGLYTDQAAEVMNACLKLLLDKLPIACNPGVRYVQSDESSLQEYQLLNILGTRKC